MRNLKKFLALVLAMVMAFSLMVTVNAKDITADFTDAESVTEEFQEAVDVTNGMGILQGYEDGTYKPKNNIRRSEVTALVYRLFTGDVKDEQNELQKHYVRFKDVSSDDWFAGYVGACQNAELIKGDGAGNFMPNRNVTGYEALAMILRAMGYDQNHEFEGTGWQVRVGAIATQRGILKNINNTNYSATLSMPATRELVAEMIFQAAQKDTVVYTPGLGYQTANVSTGVSKDSLGETYFGLTPFSGIVVGNQDTGEAMTRVNENVTDAPAYTSYFHQTKNWNENLDAPKVDTTATSITIDAVTGLDWFGHSVSGWYCKDSGHKGATAGQTFALYDDVVKTALVTAGDARLSGGAHLLGNAAQAAGFSVDLANSKAVFNRSFGISAAHGANAGGEATGESDYVANGANAKSGLTKAAYLGNENQAWGVGSISNQGDDDSKGETRAAAGGEYGLYLLISNNSANTVDMVISLKVQASKITQVNNYGTYPTVTVPTVTTDTRQYLWNMDANATAGVGERIAQDALTASSTKELGKGVVGVSIEGTKTGDVSKAINDTNYVAPVAYTQPINSPLAGGENNLFRLSTPSSTVEGQVTQYKYDAATHTGYITIGGKRVERSLLADTITGESGLTAYAGDYKQYRAYLDSEGKYIWVEPIETRKFVYGTYIDYTTPYGSSSYEYTMIGVNDKGEQTKEVVKTFNGNVINGGNYNALGVNATYHVPYRDNVSGVAGVTPGAYSGFTTDGNGNLLNGIDDLNALGWKRGWVAGNAFDGDTDHDGTSENDNNGAGNTVITKEQGKLGMAQTAGSQNNAFFITENTKVIAVSGAGTDTQKVKVYNGITELLDGGASVTIKSDERVKNNGVISAGYYRSQIYYTQSRFTYASVQDNNFQIDTLILPADALSWTGKTNLHYVGDSDKTAEIRIGNEWFTQFTMYVDGEEQSVWVEGRDSTSNTSANVIAQNDDRFYELANTGKTLSDGTTPVYMIHDADYGIAVRTAGGTVSTPSYTNNRADEDTPFIVQADYWAATYASQTATLTYDVTTPYARNDSNDQQVSYRVDGAKVVNLNAKRSGTDKIWPGITDLGSLNDVSSTGVVYTNKLPKVSCLVDPANPLQITVIYVQWDQSASDFT